MSSVHYRINGRDFVWNKDSRCTIGGSPVTRAYWERAKRDEESRRVFLFRKGDGNEGNFPRFFVELRPEQDPFAALAALLANEYIAGKRVRRHIVHNTQLDGESEFGIYATVYEGPDGEQAFESAWLTAELQPAKWNDEPYPGWESGCWHSANDGIQVYDLMPILDASAKRQYRAMAHKP